MSFNIEDKDKLFSQLSHDLRGSFTSILGFSNILSDSNENLNEAEVREFGKRIVAQANDSLELLVNFINWLKLEKFNALLDNEQLALSVVLGEIINLNQNKLKSLNITPVINLIDTNHISIDYQILSSILNNIINYLLRFLNDNGKLKFSSFSKNDFTILDVSASSSAEKIDILKEVDFRDPNSENAFPIIFAIRFIELCGGELKLSFSKEDIYLQLSIPLNPI